VSERDHAVEILSFIVWPAPLQLRQHTAQNTLIRRLTIEFQFTADSTHYSALACIPDTPPEYASRPATTVSMLP
jgi:hypothetical protein